MFDPAKVDQTGQRPKGEFSQVSSVNTVAKMADDGSVEHCFPPREIGSDEDEQPARPPVPPIFDAAKRGDTLEVQSLIATCADLQQTRAVQDSDQSFYTGTPLHIASRFGHAETVKALAEAGADVEADDRNPGLYDFSQQTPMHQAALRGHVAVVRVLIEASADIELQDESGATPVHAAAKAGQEAAVRALVEANADVEAGSDCNAQRPLMAAAGDLTPDSCPAPPRMGV